jgi:hypothetical protein
VKMRYWIDGPRYTLEQVWEEFNVTRERVRQIEQKVIQKLKEHAGLQKILGIEDDIAKLEAWEGKKKKKWRKSKEETDDFENEENDYMSRFDDDDYLDE